MNDSQAALDIIAQHEATERMKQHHRAAFSGAASTKPPIKGCAPTSVEHPQAAECSTDVGANDDDDVGAHWAVWPFISACAVTCCVGLAFGIPALWHFIAVAIR